SLWALGCLLRTASWRACLRGTAGALGNHHLQAAVLLLAGFGALAGWLAWQESTTPYWDGEAEVAPETTTVLKPSGVEAKTDRGQVIPLMVVENPNQVTAEGEERYLK